MVWLPNENQDGLVAFPFLSALTPRRLGNTPTTIIVGNDEYNLRATFMVPCNSCPKSILSIHLVEVHLEKQVNWHTVTICLFPKPLILLLSCQASRQGGMANHYPKPGYANNVYVCSFMSSLFKLLKEEGMQKEFSYCQDSLFNNTLVQELIAMHYCWYGMTKAFTYMLWGHICPLHSIALITSETNQHELITCAMHSFSIKNIY